MTEEQKIQHEYLLADFGSIKAEIARRSNSQKAALAAAVAFYAWLLNAVVLTKLGVWHIAAMWIVVVLAAVYYKREGLEISRLGTIAKRDIAEVAARQLKVPPESIIPSECCGADVGRDTATKALDTIFSWLLFGAIPLVMTVVYVFTTFCKNTG